MTVESDVRDVLINDATVGAAIGTRVYPKILPPEATLPAVVYHEISSVKVGEGATLGGLRQTRIQLDIIDTSYTSTKTLRSNILAALNASTLTADLDGLADFYENEAKLYRETMDWIIAHE